MKTNILVNMLCAQTTKIERNETVNNVNKFDRDSIIYWCAFLLRQLVNEIYHKQILRNAAVTFSKERENNFMALKWLHIRRLLDIFCIKILFLNAGLAAGNTSTLTQANISWYIKMTSGWILVLRKNSVHTAKNSK